MSRHPYVVDIFGELVCRPFLFAILASEVERFDEVAVEGGLFSVDHRIMTVDFHCPVIVRDKESEDLSMKLFFALHKSEEFDNTMRITEKPGLDLQRGSHSCGYTSGMQVMESSESSCRDDTLH